MNNEQLPELTRTILLLFSAGMVFSCSVIALFFYLGWKKTNGVGTCSPFTGSPLRLGKELTFEAAEKIARFLLEHSSKDNPTFDINKAAICPDTGRIFPNCVGPLEVPKVPKNYFSLVASGNFTPFYTLSSEAQERILSKIPLSLDKLPKTLYIDLNSLTLVGWKGVPGTSLEVLIQTRPQKNL